MPICRGTVYLVGAGPGDPGLITVRGLSLLRQADVVVCDRLVSGKLLKKAKPQAEIIHAGKARGAHRLTQDQINALLVERARAGLSVVRLKGGDPFVFGRGFEEWTACRKAGVPCVVVPGVTSAIAAPGAVGVPLTARGLVQSAAIVAGESGTEDDRSRLDFQALAAMDTVVILMGRRRLSELTFNLIAAGKSVDTPAACIERATTARQRATFGTLATIAEAADRDDLKPPIVAVVGPVVALAAEWHGSGSSAHPPRQVE